MVSGPRRGFGAPGASPGGAVGAPTKGARLPFGPDGMPLDAGAVDDGGGQRRHGVELHDQGWFHAECNRHEQEQLARVHLDTICKAVDARQMQGTCPDGRWTNDPEAFPDLSLRGTMTSSGVAAFPPNDGSYFICGKLDLERTKLREAAIPGLIPDQQGQSTWVRLTDIAYHGDAVHVFDETARARTHMGRVFQGSLDNGYFVEALQAISTRPKLARQLFLCWDVARCVYICRLFKHGTWMRVEVDDYMPVGPPSADGSDPNVAIPCRSEHYPHVVWPTIVEKAYAKVHTFRDSGPLAGQDGAWGGWEALAGGGHVEEALADLTGGVAGRFHTCDVTVERLFLYIHELQGDTLFVVRPHQVNCELHGVRLNAYYPYTVNRAVVFEGRPFVQLFCGAPSVYDGGLQDISVPHALLHAEEYPETSAEGFFWCSALDFHEYFDTVFECRLVNSGDVSIQGMPPPRLPPSLGGAPGQRRAADGSALAWFEFIHANPGEVTTHNEPEFNVIVPSLAVPCEVVCSVEQIDPRMLMTTPDRLTPAAILVKVYEKVGGRDFYSKDLVCKSNWIAVRDSVVAFKVTEGGEFKLVAELPHGAKVPRMVFRCYSTKPNVQVTAGTAYARHSVVLPTAPPRAHKATLVGCEHPDRVAHRDKPHELDHQYDSMRRPEWDVHQGWEELADDIRQDCSVM